MCNMKSMLPYMTSFSLPLMHQLLSEILTKLIVPVIEKTNNLGSDQVRHKLACTVTEDGWRLEILDLESRGIVLSV